MSVSAVAVRGGSDADLGASMDWTSGAALVLFALSVPVDVLAVSWMWVAPLAAGGALVLAGVLNLARTKAWRPTAAPLRWLIAYVAWTAVSLAWAHDLPPSLVRVTTNLQLLAMLLLAWQVGRTWREVRAIMAGFVLGCVVVSVGAWKSFLAGVTFVEMKFGPGLSWEEARYVALGFDPNDMGLTLAIGMLLAGYLGLTGSGRARLLWLASLPLALSAVALSGSRGSAFASAIALGVVMWWIGRQSRSALVLAVACLTIGAAVVWIEKPETWERIFTMRQQLAGGGTLGERIPIWREGWKLFLENPFFGVGVGDLPAAVAAGLGYGIVAHNTPLSIAAATGLVGLVLFFGAVLSIGWRARGIEPTDRSLVIGLLVVWFVGVSSLTWEYRKTTWLVLLIGAGITELRRLSPEAGTA